MAAYANLQVHAETRDALQALKEGGESYDQVIQRLMAIAARVEEHEFLEEVQDLLADDAAFRPLR